MIWIQRQPFTLTGARHVTAITQAQVDAWQEWEPVLHLDDPDTIIVLKAADEHEV